MKKLKRKRYQPWLTATGVEIPTHKLREICAAWNTPTWEAYLAWYESGCREKLVLTTIYDKICDEQTQTIFEQFQQNCSVEKRAYCEQILSLLPPIEAEVLRLHFLEGRTEVEIGFQLNRSQTGISLIKNRGLLRPRRGNAGDQMLARQYVKGESFSNEEEPSLWDEPLQKPLKESRYYDPKNHSAEFARIETSSVRIALQTLSDLEQRILYLRYWCEFSLNQTAHAVNCGVNITREIETASITKVKRNAIAFETGITSGDESCA